jgi:hypothetical protein
VPHEPSFSEEAPSRLHTSLQLLNKERRYGMESVSSLVLAVEDLSVVRGRMDASHSDASEDAGGDGYVGDGLNIPAESAG